MDNNKTEEDKNNDETIKKEVNLESSGARKCSVVEIESEEQWFAMLGNLIQNKSIENK